MDIFRPAILTIAPPAIREGRPDPGGQQQQFSPEDLDELAEFAWRLRGLKAAVAARVTAARRSPPLTPPMTISPHLPSGEDWVTL